MHWILEDMLRRTPLLPYLLQIERLAAESASPTGRPLQLAPPSLGSTDTPDRYPPSAQSGKGVDSYLCASQDALRSLSCCMTRLLVTHYVPTEAELGMFSIPAHLSSSK